MHRRAEAERRGLGRHVMHAAVGDHDRAGDAVRRHVGERRARAPRTAACRRSRRRPRRPRRSAPRAPGMRAEPLASARRARPRSASSRSPKFWLGLLSTTTATTEGSGSRSSRVSDGLASASTSRRAQRAHGQAPRLRTTTSSSRRTTATRERAHHSDDRWAPAARRSMPKPNSSAPTAPASRAAPACAPGRPCSCRSACTSRC